MPIMAIVKSTVMIFKSTGAGGDEPKLLVVESRDGRFYLEGALPEPGGCRDSIGRQSRPGSGGTELNRCTA